MATVVDTVLTPPPTDGTPVYRLAAGTEQLGEYQRLRLPDAEVPRVPSRRAGDAAAAAPVPPGRLPGRPGRGPARHGPERRARPGHHSRARVVLGRGAAAPPSGIIAPDDAATEDADGPVTPVLSDPCWRCATGWACSLPASPGASRGSSIRSSAAGVAGGADRLRCRARLGRRPRRPAGSGTGRRGPAGPRPATAAPRLRPHDRRGDLPRVRARHRLPLRWGPAPATWASGSTSSGPPSTARSPTPTG